MQTIPIVTFGALLIGLAGCQCCGLTEQYQDGIDHVADHQPHLDHLYSPALDLTRIGYPDWCSNPVNRWIYGDCCCRDTRQPPAYLHNPIYSPSQQPKNIEPIPEAPQIPPRQDTGPDSTDEMGVPTKLKGIPDPRNLEKGDQLPPLPPLLDAPAPTPSQPM